MGTTPRALKETGNEDLVPSKNDTADRAYTVPVPPEAVKAALDVHETILPAIQRRKGGGANRFPIAQFCGAYRADLRISGDTFALGFGTPVSL